MTAAGGAVDQSQIPVAAAEGDIGSAGRVVPVLLESEQMAFLVMELE